MTEQAHPLASFDNDMAEQAEDHTPDDTGSGNVVDLDAWRERQNAEYNAEADLHEVEQQIAQLEVWGEDVEGDHPELLARLAELKGTAPASPDLVAKYKGRTITVDDIENASDAEMDAIRQVVREGAPVDTDDRSESQRLAVRYVQEDAAYQKAVADAEYLLDGTWTPEDLADFPEVQEIRAAHATAHQIGLQAIAADEAEFRQRQSDYDAAKEYLVSRRMEYLRQHQPNATDKQLRDYVAGEAVTMADGLFRQGASVAARVYALARESGYQTAQEKRDAHDLMEKPTDQLSGRQLDLKHNLILMGLGRSDVDDLSSAELEVFKAAMRSQDDPMRP